MQSFKSIAVILLISFTVGVLSADNETTEASATVSAVKADNVTETATVAAINNDDPQVNARSNETATRVPEAAAAESTTKPPLMHGNVEKKTSASTVTNETGKNTTKPEQKSGVAKINSGFLWVIFIIVLLVGNS